MSGVEDETRLARTLRDLPALHAAEKRVTFDPVQMAFLQKLVRESALQAGITIRKEDFFRGLVYADTFAELVGARTTLWDDVRVMVEELEKIHPYLDVDLGLLVRYTGIYIGKDLRGEAFFKPASAAELARRHERANAAAVASGGDADPLDRAIARFTLAHVNHAAARAILPRLERRADLRAAIFCDAILSTLPPGEIPAEALDALGTGRMAAAATALLATLFRSSREFSLADYVARMAPG